MTITEEGDKEIKEKEVKERDSLTLRTKHLNTNLMNYLFLFLAVLLIGIFSPTGIIRAVLTAVALYIYTYSIHCTGSAFKPLADFLTKAGSARLFNSELIGFVCAFCWLLWLLLCNYLIHRFAGVTIFDNFIILFWILLYTSVHIVNFLFLKKTKNGAREITELLNIISNKHVGKEIGNMGNPKINIVLSCAIVLTLIFILKTNAYLVRVPEGYLKNAEDTILQFFFPNTKFERHNMKL